MENSENRTIGTSKGDIYDVIHLKFDANENTGGKIGIIYIKKQNADALLLRFLFNFYPSYLNSRGANDENLYNIMHSEIAMELEFPGSDDFDEDEDEDGEFYIRDLY